MASRAKKQSRSKRVKKKQVVNNQSTNTPRRPKRQGGHHMAARRDFDPIGSFGFIVEIDGIATAGFSRLDGLESTTDVMTYIDGSDNTLRKLPGRTKYSNLTLYHGLTTNDELWQWRKSVIDGRVERKNGSIVLLAEARQEIMRYNFHGAWPCRWKNSALDATGSAVLIEELELVVEFLERVS
jgi:phage tail-like protein